jgi:catechol 2,3-dioxygenase-like lactoylglutathione lyase family enzyme
MPLTTNAPIAFIPTTNAAAARDFYETALGLNFVSDDDFAMVFRIGPTQTPGEANSGIMLRVVRAPAFTPAPFTIFGWEVTDIHATIADLTTRGVEFLRIGYFEQNEAGVWTAPGGTQVAWFKDPDGNTLSLSTHPA